MLHAKQEMLDEAWDDLLTCHRLARLAGQGPTIVDTLVGIAIDSLACNGDRALLQHAKLNAQQVAKMREQLSKLPPVSRMDDKLDTTERYMFLDCVASVARQGIASISTLSGGGFDGSSKSKSLTEMLVEDAVSVMIDWDFVLRMGNSWYDRLVATFRKPSWSERSREYAELDRDIKALTAGVKDPNSLGKDLLSKGPCRAASERMGAVFVGLLIPAVSACSNAEGRSLMQSEVTKLGFALAAYRADHGSYPERLNELTQKYVAKVPGDIFLDDGSLHYKRQGTGYLLYSVGPNGKDDNGRGYDDRKMGEDWDDISIRIP